MKSNRKRDKTLILKCDKFLEKEDLIKNKYIIWNNQDDYFLIQKKINENHEIKIMLYDGYNYYRLFNPRISDLDLENIGLRFKINFDYFEVRTSSDDFKITNVFFCFKYDSQIKYIINNKNLMTYALEDDEIFYRMVFSNNIQEVFLESKKLSTDIVYDIINKIFIFNYFLCGRMAKLEYPISLKNKEEAIEIYGGFLYQNKDSARFSEFSIVSMDLNDYGKHFLMFANEYCQDMLPQLKVFMSTQYKNGLGIDQNIAILLNALEGFIKNQKICNNGNLKLFEKKKKDLVIENIEKKLDEYINSEEFNNYLFSLNLNEDFIIKDVKSKIKNSNGRINEMTFDQMLELSKNVSKTAKSFVIKSKLETQFWRKCKMHRNYFAHLTESKNKGFNTGYSCLQAMYVLSTFFILIILRVLGLESFENQDNIDNHAINLKDWSNRYIGKEVTKKEKEYSY